MRDNIELAEQRGTPYMVVEDQSLREILELHRANALAQVEALRASIRTAEERLASLEAEVRAIDAALLAIRNSDTHAVRVEGGPRLTIKQGVLKVLERVAPEGLSASAILERLGTDLGMHYSRTSLSPQLSRLKNEGNIGLRGNTWFLSQPENGSGAKAPEPS